MSKKGIYKYLLDLVSTFKELVEFSIRSAIVKIAATNKTLIKTNISTITFCSDWNTETKTFDLKMPIWFSEFATYIILTRNLTHYPKYQIYTLTSPLQYFLRRIFYQHMYEQFDKFFSKSKN